MGVSDAKGFLGGSVWITTLSPDYRFGGIQDGTIRAAQSFGHVQDISSVPHTVAYRNFDRENPCFIVDLQTFPHIPGRARVKV